MDMNMECGLMGGWYYIVLLISVLSAAYVVKSSRTDGLETVGWAVVVLWLPVIGLLLFFLVAKVGRKGE
jgi:hypothetical protein